MAIVAALLDSRAAMTTLRRALPRLVARVRGCRSPGALLRLVESEIVDAVVLGVRAAQAVDLPTFRQRFPRVPLLLYGAVRPDHAGWLEQHAKVGVAALLVEGIDDPVAGETVLRHGAVARRRAELADLGRSLRLTEPLQRKALDRLLGRLGPPPTAAELAKSLKLSREHLSRQFAAGGAPNLKRVIDLLNVLAARDLLQNPGYSPAVVARLLGFANPSHFGAVVRRVARCPVRDLARATPSEIRRRFAPRSRTGG